MRHTVYLSLERAKWLGTKLPRVKMTGGRNDRGTKWPGDEMTRWRNDQDKMTGDKKTTDKV
jgi:hypothetical protein